MSPLSVHVLGGLLPDFRPSLRAQEGSLDISEYLSGRTPILSRSCVSSKPNNTTRLRTSCRTVYVLFSSYDVISKLIYVSHASCAMRPRNLPHKLHERDRYLPLRRNAAFFKNHSKFLEISSKFSRNYSKILPESSKIFRNFVTMFRNF